MGARARAARRCRQTNSEGEYVDWCHDALDWADGVIVNPGAWTHYSYAIRDALELLTVPIVEVHLSNIEEREEWRRHSVIADVVAAASSARARTATARRSQFLAVEAREPASSACARASRSRSSSRTASTSAT